MAALIDELLAAGVLDSEAVTRIRARAQQAVRRLLPAEHRAKMSRGWISSLIVVNGRIAGTWNIIDSALVLVLEGAAPPKKQLAAEVEHLSGVLRQDIRPIRVA